MTDIRWNILQPVDIGAAFQEGMAQGEQQRAKIDTRNALAAYAANPEDRNVFQSAFATLAESNPEAAFRLAEHQRAADERRRNSDYRSAYGRYVGGDTSAGSPNGGKPVDITTGGVTMPGLASGAPGIVTGDQPPMPRDAGGEALARAGGQPSGMVDPREQAWREMVAADPEKAVSARDAEFKQQSERLKVANDAYGYAISRLQGATDEASYQAIRNGFLQMLAPLGIADQVAGNIPANYPGPEGVQQLLMSAMDAKAQLEAQARQDRLDWDIQDDEIDNTREDRKADSIITSRTVRDGVSQQREARMGTREARLGRGGGSGGGRRRGGSASGPTATGPNGEKIRWDGKAWVPAR
ncbi:hypothetical protein [Sphingomonas sanxanigenens]|uniref:Uncharacterized protein n=1 Tax=Sphingomonas sanxanigenens DSM 19645 = NX02 TaxID=1123269 RepID=W0AAX0_9SPHN|nr:hypothetical protein [Sphingomonas sanxanigenens]AHE52820.1 hypothetical protein NX02_05405 [Sphingomonas sanxanigenens DSM 19645 = NX02]